MIKKITVAMLCSCIGSSVFAAPGDLDTSFGSSGYAQQDYAVTDNYAYDACVSPDSERITVVGSMPVGGINQFMIAQFSSNGAAVSAFGLSGGYTTDGFFGYGAEAYAVDVSTTNHAFPARIVAAGYAYNAAGQAVAAVNRYMPNGRVDLSFGGGRGVMPPVPTPGLSATYRATYPYSVKIDSNSKILVGGWHMAYSAIFPPCVARGFLTRLNWNGRIDTNFGFRGFVLNDLGGVSDGIYDVAMDGTNKIYALSYYSTGVEDWSVVTAYHYSGIIDTNFGLSGSAFIDFTTWLYPSDIEIDANTNIVVAGYTDTSPAFQYFVARLTSAGSYDTNFAGIGYTTGSFDSVSSSSYGADIQLDSSGNILLGGGTGTTFSGDTCSLARFLDDGSLDTSFGTNGIFNTVFSTHTYLSAIGLDSGGNIIAAGYTDNGSDEDIELFKVSN